MWGLQGFGLADGRTEGFLRCLQGFRVYLGLGRFRV